MLQLAAALRLKLRTDEAIADDERTAILTPNETITSSISGLRIWSLFVLEFSLPIWLKKMHVPTPKDPLPANRVLAMSSASQRSMTELFRILLVSTPQGYG